VKPASWAARLARREVCASCSDPPDEDHAHCAYHRERRALIERAKHDPSIIVPPARPRRNAARCAHCSGPHQKKRCTEPEARSARLAEKNLDRRKREDRRYAAGLCIQCEDPRDCELRRCKACREYHREQVREAYYARKERKKAA